MPVASPNRFRVGGMPSEPIDTIVKSMGEMYFMVANVLEHAARTFSAGRSTQREVDGEKKGRLSNRILCTLATHDKVVTCVKISDTEARRIRRP